MELLSSHAVVMARDESGEIEAEHDDGAQAEKSVQEDDVGNEGGDEQHVHRQARRAGHERRDEDGGEAVAPVLDGARGHDGGNGAGIGREQRDEGFAVEADGAHDAVGDERGAGQVAGVFEDSDEEEEEQNLGEEDEDRGDALPCAVEHERLQPSGGQQRAHKRAHAGEDVAEAVGERLADGEDHFKDADDDDEKEQRSPDAMEQDVVDLAGVFSRERSAVAGAAADLRGPGVGAGGVAEHGKRERLLRGLRRCVLIEEERNGIEAGAVDGADWRYGRAEFLGELERVDVAAARFHQVAHVEQDQRGQAESEHRRGEHELAREVQGIENEQDGVGLGRAGHACR